MSAVGRLRLLMFVTVSFAYLAFAALFIWQSSIPFNGQRHFVLFDDMMISMRHAKNLADGFGLTWNQHGERVEGMTNLLWTLYMSVPHMLGIPQPITSLFIQLSGVLVVLGILSSTWTLARILAPDRPLIWLGTALVAAFYIPLNFWTLLGAEVGLLALLFSASVAMLLHSQRAVKPVRWRYAAYFLLALATLVRLDALVTYLVCAVYMLWTAPKSQAERRREFSVLVMLLALFIGGQTLFRLVYYSEWLPNTYYLKATGTPLAVRLARGAEQALRYAPLLAVLVVAAWRWSELRLLVLVFAAQVAYSIYVGGDAWEHVWLMAANRYITAAMPMAFVALGVALGKALHNWRLRRLANALIVSALLIAWAGMCLVTAGEDDRRWMSDKSPLEVLGASFTFKMRERSFWRQHRYMLEVAYWVNELTTPQACVAITVAGIASYFLPDHCMIDILGRSDKYIARLPARSEQFYPGHNKWDYAHSLPRADVFQVWTTDGVDFNEWANTPLPDLKLRKGSPHVNWARHAQLGN
ncbi:MAG: hypothetical protein NZ571_15055 [Anaerolineae bacterium]|nr:hypothetical protein [Anaerolineae bacterium]